MIGLLITHMLMAFRRSEKVILAISISNEQDHERLNVDIRQQKYALIILIK